MAVGGAPGHAVELRADLRPASEPAAERERERLPQRGPPPLDPVFKGSPDGLKSSRKTSLITSKALVRGFNSLCRIPHLCPSPLTGPHPGEGVERDLVTRGDRGRRTCPSFGSMSQHI